MQKVTVKVVPGAKKTLVKQEDNELKVFLNVPPIEGKANQLLIEVLADYWHISKSQIEIIKGFKSRHKILVRHDLSK